MSWSIAVVAEAPADRDTAATLATRAASEAVDWMQPEYLTFRGRLPTDEVLRWRQVKPLAVEHGVEVIGFMQGEPASPDAHTAAKALLLIARRRDDGDDVDAVLLIRDSDGERDRDGLEQARRYEPWPFRVVIGLAHTKRECWHICGFEPAGAAEEEVVARLTTELGSGFRRKTESLTAKHDPANNTRSAKRVLSELTGGDAAREAACLTALPMDELVDRGRNNGLADFLAEVKQHLLPLFGGPPPEARPA